METTAAAMIQGQHKHHHDHLDKQQPRTTTASRRDASVAPPVLPCNRRLSRAAKFIVHQYLEKAILYANEDRKKVVTPEALSKLSLYELLGNYTTTTTNNNCPLVMSNNDNNNNDNDQFAHMVKFHRDALQYFAIPSMLHPPKRKAHFWQHSNQQQQDAMILSPSDVLLMQQDGIADARRTPWYQCGACHKNFTSRYYLDQHFDLKHSTNNDNNNNHDQQHANHTIICPATDWCGRWIPLSACHDMALYLEPYYGPRIDDAALKRSFRKQADQISANCTLSEMERISKTCTEMIHQCFSSISSGDNNNYNNNNNNDDKVQAYLLETLCVPQTCHGRLYRLLEDNPLVQIKHVQDWKQSWESASSEGSALGWPGIFLLFSVLLYYILYWLWVGGGSSNSSLNDKNRGILDQMPNHYNGQAQAQQQQRRPIVPSKPRPNAMSREERQRLADLRLLQEQQNLRALHLRHRRGNRNEQEQ